MCSKSDLVRYSSLNYGPFSFYPRIFDSSLRRGRRGGIDLALTFGSYTVFKYTHHYITLITVGITIVNTQQLLQVLLSRDPTCGPAMEPVQRRVWVALNYNIVWVHKR